MAQLKPLQLIMFVINATIIKKIMSTKVKIKIKSWNFQTLETKTYLKRNQGWKLIKKYKNWFGKYVAVMTKEIPNG